MTASRLLRIGLACALVGGVAGPAAAQEGVAIKNILGTMGILPPEKDPIRYRERAPLVLPPKTELPAPAAPESFASANPEWPVDPDVAAVRRRAAEERKPVLESEARRMNETNPRLTSQEMGRGRIANRGSGVVPGAPSHFSDNAKENLYLNPDQMRAMSRKNVDDTASAGAEPARRVLSDPPTGMRRSARNQTISPTYDPRVDQQSIDASPLNWLKRRFTGDDDE